MILICKTTKGKGIFSWEGKNTIHHGIPSEYEFNKSIQIIESKIKKLRKKR